MKDTNGFYADVAEIPEFSVPKDLTLIRKNVNNFEETHEMLLAKGSETAVET